MDNSVPTKPPCYIVGLPDTPGAESSMAKAKFERLSFELSKVFPTIEEVRAVVKSKNIGKEHARYEVSVEVYTPREHHAFFETGYSLMAIFDALEPKMKKLLSSRQSKVTATGGASRRKMSG